MHSYNFIDHTGQVIDFLTVIKCEGVRQTASGPRTFWLCRCICGKEVTKQGVELRKPYFKSCGCYASANTVKRNFKHGQAKRGQWTPEYKLYVSAKRNATKASLPFNLELSDIAIPDLCPCLGVTLKVGTKHPTDNSPTLDRFVPNKGYVKKNVWVISFRANRIKNDATLEELKSIVKAMEKKDESVNTSSNLDCV